ncbi:MAG: hypothetical protein HYX79_10435 [Chloroflexi bacterium]|nr:hypothetical protein [Chloroflexota bacterium]
MFEHNDVSDMIEILTTAMAIHEKEEEFFLRSASTSNSRPGKELYLEIARDINKYEKRLEHRRDKLMNALRKEQQREKSHATSVLSS